MQCGFPTAPRNVEKFETSKRMLRMLVMVAFVILTISGCGTATYEGASDYRFSNMASQVNGAQKGTEFYSKYNDSDSTIDSTIFEPHDPIAIYLKNAFFSWCPPHFLERASAELQGRNPKCRVAILVNVGSRLEQVADRGSTDNPGKIIFFSRDIQKQQFINQSFGPIYSNSAWDGNDLTVDITVLEMAEEDNARTEALLKTLASIGTSPLVSAGGQEIIGILDKLGTAFVQASSKDSVIGTYRMTLVGNNSGSSAYLPLFREGDLILVRARDDQRETIDWTNYVYDPTVGKLYERLEKGKTSWGYDNDTLCNSEALSQFDKDRIRQLDHKNAKSANGGSDNGLQQRFCYIEEHHRNYAVFSFVKSSRPGDWVPSMTLKSLREAILASDTVTALTQATDTMVTTLAQRGNFVSGRENIGKLRQAKNGAIKTYQSQKIAVMLQCGYMNSLPTLSTAIDTYAQRHCVGEKKWRDVSLTPNEFDYIAKKLLACGVTASTFSDSGMLGTPPDGTQAAAAVGTLATALQACK